MTDLGVILGEKLGNLTFAVTPEGRLVHEAVPSVRRILSAPTLPGDLQPCWDADLTAVRARVERACVAWHSSHQPYTALGAIVPELLRDAIDLHRANPDPDRRATWSVLAEVFQTAQRLLYCVGEPELAVGAADRAMVASEETDDPLLLAVSAWKSCMAALASRFHRGERSFRSEKCLELGGSDLLRVLSAPVRKALFGCSLWVAGQRSWCLGMVRDWFVRPVA